jgi:hypothetical protein
MTPEYLNTAQVAQQYWFPSAEAALMWLKRHSVPLLYLGRRVRVLRASMDEALKRSTRAHRIAAFAATSTVDMTQPTPAADGDQRAVLSGGSLRTGRRAGNYRRVS